MIDIHGIIGQAAGTKPVFENVWVSNVKMLLRGPLKMNNTSVYFLVLW